MRRSVCQLNRRGGDVTVSEDHSPTRYGHRAPHQPGLTWRWVASISCQPARYVSAR